MLLKMIYTEQMKLRRSPVWLAFFLLPVVAAFMGTYNYLQNIAILENGWYSLWTQHTLFTCYFFLPAVIGVYCAYLCRLEHTNHNWNALMTAPVPVSLIYFAKLAIAFGMVLLTQVWTGALFVFSGRLAGLSAPLPPELPGWLLFGALGGAIICALQLFLSLIIRSFAVPVGIALIGSIAGLMAAAKGYGLWFPYSLLSLGMHANNAAAEGQFHSGQFLLSCAAFLGVFCLLAIVWMKERDVVTG